MMSVERRASRPCAAVVVLFTGFLVAGAGCAHYAPPGRGANMAALGVTPAAQQALADPSIRQAFDKKPLASFPTGVAVARVQEPGYRSETAESWGTGAYSIVTTRDVETDEQGARLAKLPLVHGIAPINRLVMPTADLKSDAELRAAAAALHADVLLIYTLDTIFYVDNPSVPLSVLTLGLFPRKARVVTTASAVLMDTRNGYIYGVAEATDRDDSLTTGWTSDHAVDATRRDTETRAFEKLVGELEKTWTMVLKTHAPQRGVYSTPG